MIGAHAQLATADIESSLIRLVDSVMDDLQTKGGGDLIEDFASAIPVKVIGNLMGVPKGDKATLRG